MPGTIEMLNSACHAFAANDVGTKLGQIVTLLNEAKADFNAHTHSGTGVAVSGGSIVSAASMTALANAAQLNICCPAMAEIAGFFSGVNTLINDIKTKYNAHTHSAAGAAIIVGQQVAAANVSVPRDVAEKLSRACPALGNQAGTTIGGLFATVAEMANTLKTSIASHNHPTLMTNATSPVWQTTTSTLTFISSAV